MRREERRRKFHEAVLNTLYPPPSPPQVVDEEENPGHLLEDFNVELINPDEYVGTGSSSRGGDDVDDDNGDGSESKPQTLTRAQRKRLRKKKFKEDACRRGKIIGPLLPRTNKEDENDNDRGDEIQRPGVRQNDNKEFVVAPCDEPRAAVGCSNRNKIKNRRLAKRVAKEGLKLSGDEKFDEEGQSFEFSDNRGNCDDDDQKLRTCNVENCDQAQAGNPISPD